MTLTPEQLKTTLEGYQDFNQPPSEEQLQAVAQTLAQLDHGTLRVSTQNTAGQWETQAWIKQALLMHLKFTSAERIQHGAAQAYDKIPLKFAHTSEAEFRAMQLRAVPGAIVRYGAYCAPHTVLMPCFVNSGAYIAEGSMIDTWASIGSCAQIGKNCHISGGAGIGGVLEPLQANPTIIEDNCFIGARSEIVEGVVVEKNSVIGMGLFIGQSTKIYNRLTGETFQGRVPAGSVVVPGSLPADDGSHSLNAAIIVKTVDQATRNKLNINELLRT